MRQLMHIQHNGQTEQLAEVDLSTSFVTGAVSRLKDSDEKSRIIELLAKGRFYEFVAEQANCDIMSVSDRKEFKKKFQRECFFWKPYVPKKARPLWHVLEREFPQLCKLITATRASAGNARGLYHYLTWIESRVMFPLFGLLAEHGIPMIPLHDGVAVPQSEAGKTKQLFESITIDVFGFLPLIKTTSFNESIHREAL